MLCDTDGLGIQTRMEENRLFFLLMFFYLNGTPIRAPIITKGFILLCYVSFIKSPIFAMGCVNLLNFFLLLLEVVNI